MTHVLILLILLLPSTVFAQSPPTPTSDPSLTPTSAPREAIEDIQKIRQAIQEKVKEKLSEIGQPTSFKKAIIGQISRLNVPSSLEISFNGETTSTLLDPEIVFINAKKSKSNLSTLKVGDQVLALGVYDPITQQLTAKRLISFNYEKDLSPLPQTIYGTITDMSQSANSVFLSLTPLNDKNQQYQIVTDTTTKYLDSALKAQTSLKFEVGQKIIAIASKSEKSQTSWKALKIVLKTTPTPAAPAPSPSPSPTN
ncbi:MAG: hypothetical protein WCT01_00715 [Candidatus Shapirobacteria bacterium]